jgi:uncharacterized protein (DUF4415 family)
MSEDNTVSYSSTDKMPSGKTDWKRLERLTDEDIAKAVAKDPEAPPLWTAKDWANAKIVLPPAKQPVTIRLDGDVIEWFKEQGGGYQTRINAVLKAYVNAQQPKNVKT